jgi:hypothetical protein
MVIRNQMGKTVAPRPLGEGWNYAENGTFNQEQSLKRQKMLFVFRG